MCGYAHTKRLLTERLSYLLEQLAFEYVVLDIRIRTSEHLIVRPFPHLVTFFHKDDVIPDLQNGVHVVGIDNGGHLKIVCNFLNQLVDDNRRFWI